MFHSNEKSLRSTHHVHKQLTGMANRQACPGEICPVSRGHQCGSSSCLMAEYTPGRSTSTWHTAYSCSDIRC